MARVPKMDPVSDQRKEVVDAVRRVPFVITQGGERRVVMMSVRNNDRGKYERQVRRALARGEQQIAAGAGYDLSSVFEEADALLNADE